MYLSQALYFILYVKHLRVVCPADLRREAYHLDVCSKRALSHFLMVLLFWEVLEEEYTSPHNFIILF